MPYVSRDERGAINGMFANKQPEFGEEYLPDDHPEVVAFLNPPLPINPALDGMKPKTITDILLGG